MFFFQAEDGIRDIGVTGVQTCALPIYLRETDKTILLISHDRAFLAAVVDHVLHVEGGTAFAYAGGYESFKIGRASCRERGEISVVAVSLKKKIRTLCAQT